MNNNNTPFFQPIVDVHRLRPAGYEALAYSCNDIGVCEAIGALFSDPDIDRDELLAVDRQLRQRALETFVDVDPSLFLSLNLLPEWMARQAEKDTVPTIEMVKNAGIDPSRIIIEFVESAGEDASMKALLQRYREAGMGIAIDDFGSGQAHMDRIIALEPDILKVDVDLFRRAAQGGIARKVVESIAYLTRRIGVDMLCEGVETEVEFEFALDCGARYVQGYFLGRPSPELVDGDAMAARLEPYVERYLKRRVAGHRDAQRYRDAQSHFIRSLIPLFGAALPAVAAMPTPPDGVLKAWLCSANGQQISGNYQYLPPLADSGQLSAQCWQLDESARGLNWGSRPYFSQLLAHQDAEQRLGEVALKWSDRYRDLGSGKLCQTVGVVMPGGNIFCVDIACLAEERNGLLL